MSKIETKEKAELSSKDMHDLLTLDEASKSAKRKELVDKAKAALDEFNLTCNKLGQLGVEVELEDFNNTTMNSVEMRIYYAKFKQVL